jgi:hypothetical protein
MAAKAMAEQPQGIDRPIREPALVAGARGAVWRGPDGTIEELDRAAAATRARATPPVVCHGPATARRLAAPPFAALDVLELFAFVRPAVFCSPTPRGITAALALDAPRGLAAEAEALVEAALALLVELADADGNAADEAASIAASMAAAGWPWGSHVLRALGAAGTRAASGGLDVWARLPEWSEQAPQGQPANHAVEPAEARARLAALIGPNAEPRPQQADYASAVTSAFQPREAPGEASVVLAEAGTGVGKTLAYIAPASLWAEKNQGAVWLSTYTKNLQRQLDQELRATPQDAQGGDPHGSGELPVPTQHGGGGAGAAVASGRRGSVGADGALGAGDTRWRHGGRRLSGVACGRRRTRSHAGAHRPSWRMHLLGLPPLQEVLHREGHPSRAARRYRDRQPRAGDDPGGAPRRARRR